MRIFQIKIFSLLLLPPFFAAAQTQKATSDIPSFINNPTFTNNPATNPTFNNQPIFNTEIKPQFITTTTSTINAVGVHIRDITLKIIERAQETFTKDNYHHAKYYLQQLIWEYRYKIAATTLVTTYTTANILLLTDYYYLKDPHRWSQWKSDCSFEYLCSLSQTELALQLIRAIGEHHYNKKNPNDTSHPLITFIATIETEIKICKRYLMIATAIKKLHLTTIFPINDSKINEVNKFLERCLFIKHIFLSWLAERNLIAKALKNRQFHHIKRLIR